MHLCLLKERKLRSTLILALAAVATGASAQLWDNGPLSTGAVSSNNFQAPAGTTWSECQSVGGVTNANAGFNILNTTYRIADDFTVGGAGWNVTSFTFFGYQTGSTTTSSFTNLFFEVWDGRPGDAGASVIFGDQTTNRLSSSNFANIYRIFNATTGTTRPVMANVANVNLNLGPGTYWVSFSALGSLASGPWAPPVTPLGQLQKAGSNSRQWTGAAWADITDAGGAQDIAFQINGAPVPEPASMAVLGLGALALLRRRRR